MAQVTGAGECGRRFRHIVVRPPLHTLVYKVANSIQFLALPNEEEHGSPITIRGKPIKHGAKVISHSMKVATPCELVRASCG